MGSEDDPGIVDLTKSALRGHLTKMELSEMKEKNEDISEKDLAEKNKIVSDGEDAKKLVEEFYDTYITAMSPLDEPGSFEKPSVHPCAQDCTDMKTDQEKQQDLINLVHACQCHKCQAGYCLKSKLVKGDKKQFCRFNAPWDVKPTTELIFEKMELKKGGVKWVAKIAPKRNDKNISEYNAAILRHWRANINIQIVLDATSCARYTSKYISKCEKKSEEIMSILRDMVDFIDDDAPVSQFFTKLMMKRQGQRDYGKQEVCHLNVEGQNYKSSFKVRKISMNPKYSFELDLSKDNQTVKKANLLTWYSERPSDDHFENMNLDEFTKLYDIDSDLNLLILENATDRKKTVRRFIPQYTPNPNGKCYALYCKYQLIRYKPWRNLEDFLDENQDTKEWITKYRDFLKNSDNLMQFHDTWKSDLDVAEEVVQKLEEGEDIDIPWELDDEYTFSNRKFHDSMVLRDIVPVERDVDLWKSTEVVDYNDDSIFVDNLNSGHLETFLNGLVQQCKEGHDLENSTIVDFQNVDPDKLIKIGQRKVYDVVQKHFVSGAKRPLRLLVTGEGGTGKTYTIHALKSLLGDKCVLTATTGVAANNISGQTLDSLINCCSKNPLKGKKLKKSQKE